MDSSGSPVTAVVRLPIIISWVNSMAQAFHAPEVSITNYYYYYYYKTTTITTTTTTTRI